MTIKAPVNEKEEAVWFSNRCLVKTFGGENGWEKEGNGEKTGRKNNHSRHRHRLANTID